MSNAYALISALIFAVVAIAHVLRLINRWSVVIGPYNISINVSWAALVVSALLAIWECRNNIGGGHIGFPGPLGIGPQHHRRIMSAPGGDDMHRHTLVEQQRLVSAPEIVEA